MRGWSQRTRLEAATAAFLVFFVGGCTPLNTATPVQRPSASAGVEEAPSAQMGGSAGFAQVPYIPAPTTMRLCGESVPLNRESIYERFDKEFTVIVYNHAQVYLWLKRMPRYFPVIEQRLRYYGLPDDLKYVAIAESDLLPNACSPAGAAGPWQFMPSTGVAYGLAQSRCVDDRFSFQRSTDSAFVMLKNLHDKFHSWPLALAAYNAGPKRVLDAMRAQGVNDYYDLSLPLETERYVFRILAIKAVLSDPSRYGYNLPPQYAYKPFQADQVSVSGPVSIRSVAKAACTTFSEIKRLNPVLRSDQIPAGVYTIKLPAGSREAFERNFKPGAPDNMLSQRQAPSAHVPSVEHRPAVSAERRYAEVSRREIKKEVRVVRRKARPTRAVSHRERVKGRPAKGHGRVAVQKKRVVKVHSRAVRGRAEKRRVAHKTRVVKARVLKAKGRPAKRISHKVKRKAGHPKAKFHGAKRKGGRSLARR